MKKIICTLPHAVSPINGIDFEPAEIGLRSVEPVSDEVAENFLLIAGYEAVEEEAPKDDPDAKKDDTGAAVNQKTAKKKE